MNEEREESIDFDAVENDEQNENFDEVQHDNYTNNTHNKPRSYNFI